MRTERLYTSVNRNIGLQECFFLLQLFYFKKIILNRFKNLFQTVDKISSFLRWT